MAENVILLTVCHDRQYAGRLENSLKKHGWKYHVAECNWYGFGTKLIEVYNYLVNHPEVDAFFFCDAFDVVALGSMEEALSKLDTSVITFSSERGCWPLPELEKYYEHYPHRFNYLNSGCYFAPRKLFMALFEENPPDYGADDQLWATNHYLFNDASCIKLDTEQSVFNSHSFIDEGEYGYENGRLQINGQEPILVHSNARTVDEKLEELL